MTKQVLSLAFVLSLLLNLLMLAHSCTSNNNQQLVSDSVQSLSGDSVFTCMQHPSDECKDDPNRLGRKLKGDCYNITTSQLGTFPGNFSTSTTQAKNLNAFNVFIPKKILNDIFNSNTTYGGITCTFAIDGSAQVGLVVSGSNSDYTDIGTNPAAGTLAPHSFFSKVYCPPQCAP